MGLGKVAGVDDTIFQLLWLSRLGLSIGWRLGGRNRRELLGWSGHCVIGETGETWIG
jgi:hypothetical protein